MIVVDQGSTGSFLWLFWGFIGLLILTASLYCFNLDLKRKDYAGMFYEFWGILLGSFLFYYMLNKFHIWGWPPWSFVFFY